MKGIHKSVQGLCRQGLLAVRPELTHKSSRSTPRDEPSASVPSCSALPPARSGIGITAFEHTEATEQTDQDAGFGPLRRRQYLVRRAPPCRPHSRASQTSVRPMQGPPPRRSKAYPWTGIRMGNRLSTELSTKIHIVGRTFGSETDRTIFGVRTASIDMRKDEAACVIGSAPDPMARVSMIAAP